MQLRADAANAAGSRQRTPWKAGPRGLDCSNGRCARLAPQYPVNRIQLGARASTTTSRGRITLAPPAGLVVGIGERAVAHPGAEVGGVRAVGEVGDRPVAAGAHLRPAAALAAAVLRVDRLDRLPAAVDPHLHELPVAGVAPGPQHAAVLAG